KMMTKISPHKILVVVAHPDDAELGMGMRIKKYIDDGADVKVIVLSKGGNKGKKIESLRVGECIEAGTHLGLNKTNYLFGNIPDTFFSEQRASIRGYLEDLISKYQPDTLYTHFPDDYHLDHTITSEEAVVAARSVFNIIYFRSPYSRNFHPNKFLFELESFYEYKHKALDCFKSQSLVDIEIIKKLSGIEYVGLIHPNLIESLYMKFGTKNLFYEPFQILREI
ncbi:MAG: PIG-L deacetylase family protein, partial [Candidatus Roizmanbacteria bacterium]